MEIFFCESCGRRIPAREFAEGTAVRDGAMAFCPACRARAGGGRSAGDSGKLGSASGIVAAERVPTGKHRPPSGARRFPSGAHPIQTPTHCAPTGAHRLHAGAFRPDAKSVPAGAASSAVPPSAGVSPTFGPSAAGVSGRRRHTRVALACGGAAGVATVLLMALLVEGIGLGDGNRVKSAGVLPDGKNAARPAKGPEDAKGRADAAGSTKPSTEKWREEAVALEKAIEEAKAFEKANTEDAAGIIRAWEALEVEAGLIPEEVWARTSGGTGGGAPAVISAALDAARERALAAANSAWEELEKASDEALARGDYDGALAKLDGVPEGLRPLLEGRIMARAAHLRDEAEAACGRAIEAAGAALEAGRIEEAEKALRTLSGLKYAPAAAAMETLGAKIEAARKAAETARRAAERERKAAEELWESAMAEADRCLLENGDTAGAKRAATRLGAAGAAGYLAERAEALDALLAALDRERGRDLAALEKLVGREVCWEIGGETVRGMVSKIVGGEQVVVARKVRGATMDWPVKVSNIPAAERAAIFAREEPAEGVESVAAAIRKLAKGSEDPKGAKKLLERGRGFLLAGHYLEHVRRLEIGEAEFAAEKAWEALAGGAPERLDKVSAERLRQAIERFEQLHGGTKTARDKAGELAAMKAGIASALEVKGYRGEWSRRAPKVMAAGGKPVEFPSSKWGNWGAAYDSKRKLCVMYGSSHYELQRNDMWTYDAGRDIWTCVMENDPKASNRPPPWFNGDGYALPFCYDSKRDAFWLYAGDHIWRYDPEKAVWSRDQKLNVKEGVVLACPRAGGDVIAYGYGAGNGRIVVSETDHIRTIKQSPGDVFYPWGGSSALRPGSFVSDSKGVFLLFGERDGNKQPVPATWAFDSASAEWRRLSPKKPPPGRFFASLAWYAPLDAWVLFGGAGFKGAESSANLTDTWVYSPKSNSWFEISAGTHPPSGGAIWYDEATDAIVLFTGRETWTLKLSPVYGCDDSGGVVGEKDGSGPAAAADAAGERASP